MIENPRLRAQFDEGNMKKQGWMTTGGFLSSIIAAICCIEPFVLAALGIGFGAASIFASFRPFFIVLTILFLALAFFFTYRKRKITCENGTCKLVSGSRRSKIILWIVTIISLGLITFPYWFPFRK
ncbi:MAG: hypothetical protein GWP15_03020 [Nitrospirae bacterium]|nr:hypothetical protein [Nitrospirota bacterium]